MQANRISAPKAARMMRRQPKQGIGDEQPQNWRQLVCAVFWHEQYGDCPYCSRTGRCTMRVARLTNGWEARDLICDGCLHLWPHRAGARARMLSPEELDQERDLYGCSLGAEQQFEATVKRFFPSDDPIVSRLYVENPVLVARRKRQMLLPCCANS